MRKIVDFAINHARLTLALLVFLLISGLMAYQSIPKEASPDVTVPIIYVQMSQRGISPEDAERLLVRPMESGLKSVANIKEMRSAAFEGGGYVLLEFQAGFKSDTALRDVRAKVEDTKRQLPTAADQPGVFEVNLSLFPIVTAILSGDLSERALVGFARQAKREIEAQVPGVLSADLNGVRDEVVEVIAQPMLMKSYGVSLGPWVAAAAQGNSVVAAGALESPTGAFPIKVPALIETPQDVLDIPVTAGNNATVKLGDVADVRPTFKDATSITRVNGLPAVAIEIKKRAGANIIDTVDGVRKTMADLQSRWPEGLKVNFIQDASTTIRTLLGDLQNSVLTGVLLVIVIILFILGARASLFVGIAIPASFLTGILGLQMFGLTLNIVALFSLILAVGMLVDDAIIVAEFAERRMSEGMTAREAYALAATRMAGPVTAATLTRIAAFSPLLFWPGLVGQFMKYMPITLIATLSASLVTALIFTPTLGALIGRPQPAVDHHAANNSWYMRTVRLAVRRPGMVILLAIGVLGGVIYANGKLGKGVEFFPNVEPDTGAVLIHARGNLSLAEKDALVRSVEGRLLAFTTADNAEHRPELETVYARSGSSNPGGGGLSQGATEDVIGQIRFSFVDWKVRRPAKKIMDAIRAETADLPGINVEVIASEAGPPTGKPIQIQLSSDYPEALTAAAKKVTAALAAAPEVRDLDSGLPLPGIDWKLDIDKSEAARYGISVGAVGLAVQLVTNGVKITDYRPPSSDKAVDIILRYPEDRRTLADIDSLRIETALGSVPIGNFIKRVPVERVGVINRVAGTRVDNITANLADKIDGKAVNVSAVQETIKAQLAKADFGGLVTWKLKGSDQEQAEASAFLGKAFGAALFLIFAVLLLQFNRFSSVGLILFAVILSTIGVLLGLIIMQQVFGIVMTMVGIIALAGVVTNNNIVLIDTYDRLRREGVDFVEAILTTCRERARPVLLTAITAILGVLPIAFGINLDFVNREVTFGAPSTQWWIQLSTAIVFGLGFATVLTLVVTPAQLAAIAKLAAWRNRRRERGLARRAARAAARGGVIAAPPVAANASAGAAVATLDAKRGERPPYQPPALDAAE
ncbi:MAG: efflux RND transporter permease subunit [Bauldia sp.]